MGVKFSGWLLHIAMWLLRYFESIEVAAMQLLRYYESFREVTRTLFCGCEGILYGLR